MPCESSDLLVYGGMIMAVFFPLTATCAFRGATRRKQIVAADAEVASPSVQFVCDYPRLTLFTVYGVIFLLGMSAFVDGCGYFRGVTIDSDVKARESDRETTAKAERARAVLACARALALVQSGQLNCLFVFVRHQK